MDWFRFYSEFATDPKVQMMPEEMQRRLVMLFCLQSGNGHVTLHETEIAFQMRISDEELEETKDIFIQKGFISDGWEITNWDKRQYRSDSSAERVREHRNRKRMGDVTPCNVTVTPPDTDTDTDIEEERAKALLSSDEPTPPQDEPTGPSAEQSAYDAYNAVAGRIGIPLAQNFSATRKSKLRQRLKECGGLAGWVAALDKLEASSYCTGKNERGWKADLDFLLQAQSFTRLMEGRYDDRKPQPARNQQSRVSSDEEIRRRLAQAVSGIVDDGGCRAH